MGRRGEREPSGREKQKGRTEASVRAGGRAVPKRPFVKEVRDGSREVASRVYNKFERAESDDTGGLDRQREMEKNKKAEGGTGRGCSRDASETARSSVRN